jgi:hypothetical protein
MQTGMMWFDNDPKTALGEKVSRAAEYYRQKYGKAPNLCLVNPQDLPEKPDELTSNVAVRAFRLVLPGHLWLGLDELPKSV